MLDSHLKKMIVLDILHSFSIFALWLHLLEEKTTRQAGLTPKICVNLGNSVK